MDLTESPEQQAFRAELREWLQAELPTEPLKSFDTAEGFEQHRKWERKMAEARWAVVNWPEEYGGRGVGWWEWLIFEEEYWLAHAPNRVSQNGIFLLAPVIMEFGTDEQKAHWLPRMARAEDIWCQGWSEPDAGSDLASLRSKAELRGDKWVINGLKTWSTRGVYADALFGLFRTDPESERHRGLTYLMVPMDAPGVTVRPIEELDGREAFAEVFFEDVEVPADLFTLGPVNEGWRVAMSTTSKERGIVLRSPGRFMAPARDLVELAKEVDDPVLVDGATKAWIDTEAYKLHTDWAVSAMFDGHEPGAETSLNKLFWSELDVRIHELALRMLGPRAELVEGSPDAVARWLHGFVFSIAGPIYAGTNEIQRNIVAERVLGLPRK